MTRKTIITCECCGQEPDTKRAEKDGSGAQELGLVVRFGVISETTTTFDFCDDCIAKVAGHGVADPRCSKSIIHQSEQAVLAMFKAEVRKFDAATDQEEGVH